MKLKDKLEDIKSGFKKNADPESQEIMALAQEQLQHSEQKHRNTLTVNIYLTFL